MKLTNPEKTVLVILSITLLAGAVLLNVRHSRPPAKIEIVSGGIKEELTFRQVEEILKENRRININTATSKELTIIPGVGAVLAERIIGYRELHGAFYRPDDLLEVRGVGEKKLEKIKEYVRVQDPV